MTSRASPDNPDSRTSSVGRKRTYDQISTPEDKIIVIGDDTSDEDTEQPEKRKHGAEHGSKTNPLIIAPDVPQDASNAGDEPAPVSPPAGHPPAIEENVKVHERSEEQAHAAITPSVMWNKGIPGTLRTSFSARGPQAQIQPPQSASIDGEDKVQIIRAVRQNSGGIIEPLFGKLGFDDRTNISPKSDVPIAATDGPNKKQKMRARKLKLPWSSFGKKDKQELAEQLIQTLPEANRDLLPRKVSDDASFYSSRSGILTFPREIVALSKLDFANSPSGFVQLFLSANSSKIHLIDYPLLVEAFQAYLNLYYGHLPEELVMLVGHNYVEVESPQAVRKCQDIVLDVKRGPNQDDSADASGETSLVQESSSSGHPLVASGARSPRVAYLGPVVEEDGHNIAVNLPDLNPSAEPEKIFSEIFTLGGERPIGSSEMMTDAPDTETGREILVVDTSLSNNPLSELNHADVNVIEIEQARKYFPGSGSQTVVSRCLTCSEPGHSTSDCPTLTCTTCGLVRVHFTDACPQTQRCSKCRERGHQKSECPEKLAVTSSEELGCDICKSANHLESTCHFLWRSFRPSSIEHKKLVPDIPVFCYCCGVNTHFGPQCGIRTSPLYAEGYTWSKANWEQYVDLKRNRRIFAADKSYRIKASEKSRKDFTIRGRAKTDAKLNPPNDEDEDIPFIGTKVKPNPRPAAKGKRQIKLAKGKFNNDDFTSRPNNGPAIPSSRQQLPRGRNPRFPGDRSENLLRRNMRELSFSPPPRFPSPQRFGDRFAPGAGDMQYRPDYSRDHQRYPRTDDNSSMRAQGGNHDKRGDSTIRGRGRPGRSNSARGRGGRGRTHN